MNHILACLKLSRSVPPYMYEPRVRTGEVARNLLKEKSFQDEACVEVETWHARLRLNPKP